MYKECGKATCPLNSKLTKKYLQFSKMLPVVLTNGWSHTLQSSHQVRLGDSYSGLGKH